MINSFLLDTATVDRSGPIQSPKELTVKCGYLDDELRNMFVNPAEILDDRAARLTTTFRATSYVNVNDPTEAGYFDKTLIVQGNNTFYQSSDTSIVYNDYEEADDETNYASETLPSPSVIVGSMSLIMDKTKLSTDELTALTNMTSSEREHLFNVIEYIAYGTVMTDTLVDINTVLEGTEYSGYVDASLSLSPYRSIVSLQDPAVHRFAPRHMQLSFAIGGVDVEFKIWFDRNDFRYLYTEYTVSDVLFPFEISTLLNPSALSGVYETANTALLNFTQVLVPAISSDNHTGYIGISTRHVFNGVVNYLTFGILFNGRFPNLMEVKQSIAQAILDTGIGDLETWRLRLPDLFVDNQFYFIPMWDNIFSQTNADIYPSIIGNPTEDSNVAQLGSDLVTDASLYEIITVPYDKLFIASLANDGNADHSLKDVHPTYQDYSSTEPEFNYMEANTRQFSIHLNNVLAIASGELNNNTNYATITINGKEFLSLTFDGSEYLVMTKESYLENIT